MLGEELGYDSCAAALVNDRDPDALVVGAASGMLRDLLGTTTSSRRGVCGAVLRSGKPVFVPARKHAVVRRGAAWTARRRGGLHPRSRFARARPRHVLRVCRRPPDALTEADLALLTAIVRYLGSALEVAYLHQQAKDVSGTDALTGLANRRAFLDRIEAEMARGRRTGARVTIVLLDTNEFKAVKRRPRSLHGGPRADRDRGGVGAEHPSVGSGRAVRGGDEFLVLMPDTAMPAGAPGRRPDPGVSALHVGGGELPHVTLSMCWGAATWPDDAATPDGLLRIADTRLYAR